MMADLRSYVLADSTIKGLIGTRMHLDRIPQNSQFPNCEYGIVSERVLNTHGLDASLLNEDIIQIDVYSKKASEALSIKEALKTRLNSKRVTQGTTNFQYIEWDSSNSSYESDVEIFRQIITITVMWSPT